FFFFSPFCTPIKEICLLYLSCLPLASKVKENPKFWVVPRIVRGKNLPVGTLVLVTWGSPGISLNLQWLPVLAMGQEVKGNFPNRTQMAKNKLTGYNPPLLHPKYWVTIY
ncbi:unnamed protein product, partial [Staurois parvus]